MKILLIGLGGVGQRHARNIRELLGPSVDLIAYRARRLTDVITPTLALDSTKNVEDEYHIRAFPTLDAALAQRPDVAFVCNPTSMHIEVGIACANAGCDLFIEKPLSHSAEGIDQLIAAVHRQQCIAMVGYQLRFHPCVQRLQSIVKAGQIGRPIVARATIGEYLPFWHKYEDYRQMYAARADMGGGVVLTQIHEFDYLYSIFGTPERMFALGGHLSDLEIDVEDAASVLMDYESDGRALPVHLQLDYVQYPPSRQCEIIGSSGKVVMDLTANETRLYKGQNAEPKIFGCENFVRNQLFLDELRHYFHCVETREQPMITLEDGAQSLAMALAAKKSIETQQIVPLPSTKSSAGSHAQ